MSGKPKTIPSPSRERTTVSDSREIPVPYDQNRANKLAGQMNVSSGSESPTDENFVNDDIIEENSHVIPPVKKTDGKQTSKRRDATQ
jgi:hypothetical protein